MKSSKYLAVILFLFLIFVFYSVKAHDSTLDVEYDPCEPLAYVDSTDIGDGYLEKWYELVKNDEEKHIPHNSNGVTEIKYYVSPTASGSSYTWTTDYSSEFADTIKNGFIESMKKWNNVFYYKLNSDGVYEKHRVVNVVEGTYSDHNLIIYPVPPNKFLAGTSPIIDSLTVISSTPVVHNHYSQWKMQINLDSFYSIDPTKLAKELSRAGAHELGHVLGLTDIDDMENPDDKPNYHHEENLMGYGRLGVTAKQKEITFRDIAGVSITRGLHGDSDHCWLYDSSSPRDGQEKLICSLCNCVKYVDDLSLYDYDTYLSCGHDPEDLPTTLDEYMIPVASYGDTDYYKCKYCRYVAPFTSRVEHNYSVYDYDSTYHIYENNVTNLNYRLKEEHEFSIHISGNVYKCKGCGYCSDGSYYYGELDLNCQSTLNSVEHHNKVNESLLYKIRIRCTKYYRFISSSDYAINMTLYDSSLNSLNITPSVSNNGCTKTITSSLNSGTYYLKINYTDSTVSGDIETLYSATNPVSDYEVMLGSNNLLTYLHFLEQPHSSIKLKYNNIYGPGFCKFTIDATVDIGFVTYPAGAISLYDDSTRTTTIDRLDILSYNYSSVTNNDENSMWVYLPRNGYFYIDINMPNVSYTSLSLTISEPSNDNIDIFDMPSIMSTSNITLLSNISDHSDFVKEIEVKQPGVFTIYYSTTGTLNNNYDIFLVKKDNLQVIYSNSYGNGVNRTLEEGVYYLGYFNLTSGTLTDFHLNRFIENTMYDVTNVLITDPDSGSLCGSEINIIEMNNVNKSYRGTNITVGYTRLIYFDQIDNYYSLSRLDYYWYSSDESKALVTQYGTVYGISPTLSNETVTILAILKSDPSIIFIKEFTINNDDGTGYMVVESNISVKYSDTNNGLFHLHLENCNVPYPMYSYYTWNTSNISNGLVVTNENFGNYTVSGAGSFDLVGTNYIYNTNYINVVIVIHVTITNN